MRDLRRDLSLTAENVDFVECRVAPGVFRPLLSRLPTTGLEGKFSMDYVMAAGVLDGRFDLETFSDAAVSRPEIRALYPRMRKCEDPTCLGGDDQPLVRSAGTLGYITVKARRRDGAEHTVRVDKPRGSPEHELTWDDSRDKFLGCARHAGLDPEAAASLFAAWRSLDAAPCVAPLLDMLAKQ